MKSYSEPYSHWLCVSVDVPIECCFTYAVWLSCKVECGEVQLQWLVENADTWRCGMCRRQDLTGVRALRQSSRATVQLSKRMRLYESRKIVELSVFTSLYVTFYK